MSFKSIFKKKKLHTQFSWSQRSKVPHGDHFVGRLAISHALLLLVPHAFHGTLVCYYCHVLALLCRLRSIVAHRDHFVRRLSVCPSVRPSVRVCVCPVVTHW